MTLPAQMPPHDRRFRWHSDATAHVYDTAVRPRGTAPQRAIVPDPVATCLGTLAATLGTGTPFCISDTTPDGLADIAPNHFITLTGGSSGAPKAILRSQSSWIRSFTANAAQFAYDPRDSVAVLGPLTHSLSLYGVIEALHTGLDAHLLGGRSPSAQATWMRASGCTVLYATPTQLRLIARADPLPRVRLVMCGGGALDPATRTRITALCPNAKVHVFYGAAETSFITLSAADTPPGSVGQAYPGVEIAVRDATGADTTDPGTVWVRSPYLFDRYLAGDSPHTRRIGDFLTVGEHGRMDQNGNLFLHGRAGRMVTVADKNVFLEEIEAHLATLEGIEDCAVLALPDPLRGHRLVAVVSGLPDPDLSQRIKAHFQSALAPHLRPRTLRFLAPFPRLPSGKADLAMIATALEATS